MLALTALVFLFAVLIGMVLYHWVEHQEERLIDEIVADELVHLHAQYRRDPGYVPGEGRYLSGYILLPGSWPAPLPKALRDLPDGIHEITTATHGEWHVAVRTLEDGRKLLVRYDASAHEKRLADFALALSTILLLVVGAIGLLGYTMAAHLVRPLEDLAARIERLPPPSRPSPAQVQGPADRVEEQKVLASRYRTRELIQLARAFDRYRGRMEELLCRERDFSAHVSHELRTPLSVLRSGLELLMTAAPAPATGGEQSRKNALMARIERAVARLEAIVGTLFLLSRTGRPAEALTLIALRDFVEEWIATHGEALRRTPGSSLSLDIPAEVRVLAPRTVLELVVGNLLTNAFRHAPDGEVRVSWQDGVLSVEDSGGGITPSERQRVFERFYRAAGGQEGLGIGLTLVKRLSELYDWRVWAEDRPQGGTRMCIAFPG